MPTLSSEKFEVTIEGSHGIIIPERIALPFVERGLKRLLIKALYKEKEIEFHGALHRYLGNYIISFGKRYQKPLGIDRMDYFTLQLF